MNTIRVLLIDDHRIFLAGLRSFLEKHDDVTVVGQAEDGRTGIRLSAELSADVVVMDVSMPGLNGVDTTRELRKRLPEVRVLALSAHSEPQLVAAMLRAGAAGYLLKSSDPAELTRAIRAAAQGHAYLSPYVAGPVVDGYLHRAAEAEELPGPALSSREREVLVLLAEGKSARDIAVLLNVGRKTVETYRHRIMCKLDLHSLTDLVKYAIREGLTSAGP